MFVTIDDWLPFVTSGDQVGCDAALPVSSPDTAGDQSLHG